MTAILLKPDAFKKLDILAGGAKYDVCMSSCATNATGGRGRVRDPKDPLQKWIYPAHLPGKGQVQILKVLQTNQCTNKCSYCSFAANKDGVRRTTIAPQDLADSFMRLHQRRLVEGIFLTSGVCNGHNSAMEKMVTTAEILRMKYKFKGYIHLKVLPGATFDLVERAAMLATRLSVNLEAPGTGHLKRIAPDKTFTNDLLQRMRWVGKLIENGAKASSQTTQFVVGASDEKDMEILKTVDYIYREQYVFRSYFSAYQEERAAALALESRAGLVREHRLYQSDYLLRGYGFRLPDLVFDQRGELPDTVDPKTAYAMMHPELFPVDINKAEEPALLRVPGIGPISAQRILQQRVTDPFHSLEELRGTGALVRRAAHYIEFSGKGQCQLHLFEAPPPKGWITGIKPVASIENEPEAPGNGPQQSRYDYPGQKGKRLYYAFNGQQPVLCR